MSSNRRSTSTGIAAPAEMQTRNEPRSRSWPAAAPSIAAYMEGRPSKTVTRSAATISNALPGSNLGSSASVAPAETAAPRAACHPERIKQWQARQHDVVGPNVEQAARNDGLVADQVAVGE